MSEIRELELPCGITVQVSSDGKIYKDEKECKIKQYPEGYCYVTFKSNQHYLVHRLVASAFIMPLKRGDRSLQVHHINEIKTDNRVENLEIMTTKQHQHLHKQIYPIEKKCVVCGKTFIPKKTKRKRAQTCSYECWKTRCIEKSKSRSRKINQYSKQGELVRTWESARTAQIELGIFESNINKCCNGHIKTYKGYIWRYAD